MARYGRQCLAVGGRDFCRPAKHSRADGSLWRHRQEEMGDQLRLHVDLRFRLGPGRLGSVRLQHGVRASMVPVPRQAEPGDVGRVHHRPGDNSGRSRGHAAARLPDGDPHLLPVRVRCHHRHHPRRLGARPHELQGVGDLLPGVDDPGLYRGGVQPVGRRLARRHGRGRLLGRLRHPSCRRHLRLRRRGDGRPAPATGSRPFPAQ